MLHPVARMLCRVCMSTVCVYIQRRKTASDTLYVCVCVRDRPAQCTQHMLLLFCTYFAVFGHHKTGGKGVSMTAILQFLVSGSSHTRWIFCLCTKVVVVVLCIQCCEMCSTFKDAQQSAGPHFRVKTITSKMKHFGTFSFTQFSRVQCWPNPLYFVQNLSLSCSLLNSDFVVLIAKFWHKQFLWFASVTVCVCGWHCFPECSCKVADFSPERQERT